MAQGHTIPIIDIAKMLAARGVAVTILTTPTNAARSQSTIDHAAKSGLTINVVHVTFPCIEAGLPAGFENLDMVRSANDAMRFFRGAALMRDPVQQLLADGLTPPPTCLISDMWFPWTTAVSAKLNIPRLVFYGTSCFFLLCMHILGLSEDFRRMSSDSDYFVVPHLPDRVEVTRAQFKATYDQLTPEWTRMWDELREAESQAFGTVANSFDELETHYINSYTKAKGIKVWCIGPVSLFNKKDSDKAIRGQKATNDLECLKWLDSQEPGSVIYVCLGSMSHLSTPQFIELGLGLEASRKPFIWVIRNGSSEVQTWLKEENYEKRINGRGLLIQGWAPQVLILPHPSIGGFLTHCGWNSTLEGISAGLPMVTWPMSAEQFFNEKLIVSVIRIGVRVGAEVPMMFLEEGSVVRSDEIRRAVEVLMDGGREGGERRERARKMGEMARRAMEDGGSSCRNMTLLIQDVMMQQAANINSNGNGYRFAN